jgi:DNA-binding SARP family transcriptional activator/tetratricopeptide (TPR) repeat protein
VDAAEPSEAMRVLGDSAMQALGTAAWGPATELLARMPEIEPPLAVRLVRARALIAVGDTHNAVALLPTDTSGVEAPVERALVRIVHTAAYQRLGEISGVRAELQLILDDDATPASIRALADVWLSQVDAALGAPLGPASDALQRLAAQQEADGLLFYAGISRHNAAEFELARGNFASAIHLASTAIDLFETSMRREIAASQMTIAIAAFEQSDLKRFDEALRMVDTFDSVDLDVKAARACNDALMGDLRQARYNLSGFDPLADNEDRTSMASAIDANGVIALCEGDFETARTHFSTSAQRTGFQPDSTVFRRLMEALCAWLLGDQGAAIFLTEALELCIQQGARRWEPRLRLLQALASGNREEASEVVRGTFGPTHLALLELADAIGASLDLFDPMPSQLEASIVAWPRRWLPILRRQLEEGFTPSAKHAASLLASFGSEADAQTLHNWERKHVPRAKQRFMSRELARRLSPTLQIHDLGRTTIAVGSREVGLTRTRRKVASLLLYLVTRPNQVATRDQVIDDLWPDQDLSGGSNSLHQTLFFLRRDIDPIQNDFLSVDYVLMESELLCLDPKLVHIDSVSFHRQATAVLASDKVADGGVGLTSEYTGRFAPEFEYDEWATSWRDRVHTTYLQLVQATADGLMHGGRARKASEVLTRALVLDPTALELEPQLVKALWEVGARAAAKEQYEHYATACRKDLGIEAEPLAALVQGT